MITEVRETFNAHFTADKFNSLLTGLDNKYGIHIPFRVAETPIFLPQSVKEQLILAGDEIIRFLVRPDFMALTDRAIPERYRVPHETRRPLFLAIDFALADDGNGGVIPQLIELQGFPSLYAYQPELARNYRDVYEIDPAFTCLFSHQSEAAYADYLRTVLLNGYNPGEVIMLDLEPATQATYVDFMATLEKTGIRPVGLEELILRDKKLFYLHQGQEIRIRRIYNRVIFDELERRKDLQLNFHLAEEAEVEWAGHPNWFYRISKFIMPYLKSRFVPDSWFLNDLEKLPPDLENYVLKPLYSFSGTGVVFNLTNQIISSLTDTENYILQKKVPYKPVIKSPDGLVKTEIRLMYIWEEGKDAPLLVTNLCRLSRGDMIGVKFNVNKTWVGGSVALFK